MKLRRFKYHLVRWSLRLKLWRWLSILKQRVFAKVPPLAGLMEKGLQWIERESLAIARDFKPMTCGTAGHDVEIHSLLCHAHVHSYLWAIFTFQHFVRVALPVVVHDDGTLTNADKHLLETRIKGIRIISRSDADAQILAHLADRPRCLEYRRQTPFGPKLFDYNLLHHGRATIHLDSDVLFLSDASKLREIIQTVPFRFYYNPETHSPSYNDEALGLSAHFGPCAGDINAGLMYHPRAFATIDELEASLGWVLDNYRGALRKDDQLVYSIMAGRIGCEALPSEYGVAFSKSEKTMVSMHYHSVSKRYMAFHGVSEILRNHPDFVAAFIA